jgi:hypothetical protein
MPTTVADFRRHALDLAGATEGAHMGHPDFRLNNRIFATLSMQDKGRGVLKLSPEQQQTFIAELPDVFEPVFGGWGRMGLTLIHLAAAEQDLLAGALATAYRNVELKQRSLTQKSLTQRSLTQKLRTASQTKSAAKKSAPARTTRATKHKP